MTMKVRPPAVAGSFYPADRAALAHEVAAYLAAAPSPAPGTRPKAIIAPHAGYVYSGASAATAYACLQNAQPPIRRVVLLGPTHRVPVRGLAVPTVEAFATPLGVIPLDQALREQVLQHPSVVESDPAHAFEHSLEVQLPFLQTILGEGKFTLLPLAVGDATPQEVAAVLELVWGGPETLLVISSDLSHFHPDGEARQIDRRTAEAILARQTPLTHTQACGATPINGLLLAARRHHLQATLLDLRTSADTTEVRTDRSRVVGYAAFRFDEDVAS